KGQGHPTGPASRLGAGVPQGALPRDAQLRRAARPAAGRGGREMGESAGEEGEKGIGAAAVPPGRPAASCRRPPKTTSPPRGGWRCAFRSVRPAALFEVHLGGLDPVLAVLLGDGAGDRALLGLGADRLVELLAAIRVEVV